MTFVQIILTSLGASTVLTTLLTFLFREWISTRIRCSIQNEYTTQQERLKSDLQSQIEEKKAQLQGELEGLRAGYRKTLDENQVRFGKLHVDQAEVLRELYKQLMTLREGSKALTTIPKFGGTREDYYEKYDQVSNAVSKTYGECKDYFLINRLFLSESLAKNIEYFLREIFENIDLFDVHNDQECLKEADNEDRRMAAQERQKAKHRIFRENQELFQEIERQFREILGIRDLVQEREE